MNHHFKILVLTVALLGGGLLSYTLIRNGYFPVARVNGELISYRTVKENVDVSKRLYQQGLVGTTPELDQLFLRSNTPALIKNSLGNLISNIIIKKSASADVIVKANSEIDINFKDSTGLANSIKSVYDWDLATFRERILEPQAVVEVLAKEKGSGFEDWIKLEKTKAKVNVWFLPYEWEKGELKTINP